MSFLFFEKGGRKEKYFMSIQHVLPEIMNFREPRCFELKQNNVHPPLQPRCLFYFCIFKARCLGKNIHYKKGCLITFFNYFHLLMAKLFFAFASRYFKLHFWYTLYFKQIFPPDLILIYFLTEAISIW